MATRNENPAPFMAVHPGMMVKPELVERGITQKEFAKMLGIQASHLSEVLNGKRALSTDLAVKIEEVIGLPAKLLLSAQAQYDIESAKATPDDKQHETVALTIPIQDRNLLQEIVRRFGWVCVFWTAIFNRHQKTIIEFIIGWLKWTQRAVIHYI